MCSLQSSRCVYPFMIGMFSVVVVVGVAEAPGRVLTAPVEVRSSVFSCSSPSCEYLHTAIKWSKPFYLILNFT